MPALRYLAEPHSRTASSNIAWQVQGMGKKKMPIRPTASDGCRGDKRHITGGQQQSVLFPDWLHAPGGARVRRWPPLTIDTGP